MVYRDKGNFCAVPRGWDATMRRRVRGHPLGIRERLRNKRVNLVRVPGERPFTVIKRVFGAGRVLVTTLARVRVKMVFTCFCFNLVQLGSLGWVDSVSHRSAAGEGCGRVDVCVLGVEDGATGPLGGWFLGGWFMGEVGLRVGREPIYSVFN